MQRRIKDRGARQAGPVSFFFASLSTINDLSLYIETPFLLEKRIWFALMLDSIFCIPSTSGRLLNKNIIFGWLITSDALDRWIIHHPKSKCLLSISHSAFCLSISNRVIHHGVGKHFVKRSGLSAFNNHNSPVIRPLIARRRVHKSMPSNSTSILISIPHKILINHHSGFKKNHWAFFLIFFSPTEYKRRSSYLKHTEAFDEIN